MTLTNTDRRYGAPARVLHWLTALLILTAIPLGVVANNLPFDTSETLALKAQVFSWHKTVGVAAFFVALTRILWALTQTRPAPLHPERTWETRAADVVHWMLYISLLAVPLTGWVHHAATTGFAPILWPFGQGLPLVPRSAGLEHGAAAAHWVFTKLLVASILLHVAGALKHALIDRDATLARMWRGTSAPARPRPHRTRGPALVALGLYGAGVGLALALTPPADAPRAAAPVAQTAGNWQVTEGRLGLSVRQMGAMVDGQFADWTADITFDERVTDGPAGEVEVRIDIASLTLGSVTTQAVGPEFLNAPAHPVATFTAPILRTDDGYVTQGMLTLSGVEAEVVLPFTLKIAGDTAQMTGSAVVDRRAFGIGQKYGDEATVGFEVTISVDLTATRP